jgi:hypothetical protein
MASFSGSFLDLLDPALRLTYTLTLSDSSHPLAQRRRHAAQGQAGL